MICLIKSCNFDFFSTNSFKHGLLIQSWAGGRRLVGHLWDKFSKRARRGSVSACEGRCSRVPQAGWPTRQKCVVSQSGAKCLARRYQRSQPFTGEGCEGSVPRPSPRCQMTICMFTRCSPCTRVSVSKFPLHLMLSCVFH